MRKSKSKTTPVSGRREADNQDKLMYVLALVIARRQMRAIWALRPGAGLAY